MITLLQLSRRLQTVEMFTATLKMQFFSCFRVIWQAFLPCCSVQSWLCPYRLRRVLCFFLNFLLTPLPPSVYQHSYRLTSRNCNRYGKARKRFTQAETPRSETGNPYKKLFCSYARTGCFDCRCNAHFILHRTSNKSSRCKHNGICNTHACKTVPRL